MPTILCPSCGKHEVEATRNPLYGQRFMMPQYVYTCPECGEGGTNLEAPNDPRLTR